MNVIERSAWASAVVVLAVAAYHPQQRTKAKAPKLFKYAVTIHGKAFDISGKTPFPFDEIAQKYKRADEADSATLRALSAEGAVRDLRTELADAKADLASKALVEDQLKLLQTALDGSTNDLQDARRKLRDARNDAFEVQSKVRIMEIDVDALTHSLRQFDYMDWKIAVPDVKRKARDVSDEFDLLKILTDNLETL